MDYGFAMIDNTWDTLDVIFALNHGDPCYEEKSGILYRRQSASVKRYHPPDLPLPLPLLHLP